MQEILVNPILAVPVYGVCPHGYIMHEGYPVFGADGKPTPSAKGWTGIAVDPDGIEGRLLYCAFLPNTITGKRIQPLGRTFAENVDQAVAVFCSHPPVLQWVEHYRARYMRVACENAFRFDVFFPQWVIRRALGR